MTVMPYDISGFHPEVTGPNTVRFFPFEVAIGNNNPNESIRFTSAYDVYLPSLGAGGRDAGSWPSVVSTPTTWQFYACKEEVSGLNPIIIASQAISYSLVDFSHPSLAMYGPGNCRKLPYALVYDVSIGFIPVIYARDGSVRFTGFDATSRYAVATLTGQTDFQVVDCSRLVPDAARDVLIHIVLTKAGSVGGMAYAKAGSGVANSPGQEIGIAGSGAVYEGWLQTNSYRQIQVKVPSGYSATVRVKGYRDSELS